MRMALTLVDLTREHEDKLRSIARNPRWNVDRAIIAVFVKLGLIEKVEGSTPGAYGKHKVTTDGYGWLYQRGTVTGIVSPVTDEFMTINPLCVPAHDAWVEGKYEIACKLLIGMCATMVNGEEEYPVKVVTAEPNTITVRSENNLGRGPSRAFVGNSSGWRSSGFLLHVGVARRHVK